MPRGKYSTTKHRGRPKGSLDKKVTMYSDRHKFEVGPEYAVVREYRAGVRNSDEGRDLMES